MEETAPRATPTPPHAEPTVAARRAAPAAVSPAAVASERGPTQAPTVAPAAAAPPSAGSTPSNPRKPRDPRKPRPPAKPRVSGNKKRPKARRGDIPWEKIRAEYLYDADATLHSLATKHGISYATITSRSWTDGWGDQRAAALEAASKALQAEAVSRLTAGFRSTAVDAFTQISRLRKKALELYEAQIDPNATPPISSDSVVQVRHDRNAGTVTKTSARRVRPRLDSHLIETLVKLEAQWASILFGIHKPGETEKTVTIE